MATPTVEIDTAANWRLINPTLSVGEIYYEIEPGDDIGKMKIGTGDTWNSTAYENEGVINARDANRISVVRPTPLAVLLSQSPDLPARFPAFDANDNIAANNFLSGFATTATAAGTTTLTAASKRIQEFTGAATQTCVLPVVSTLAIGTQFYIINNSSGAVTVNSSGGNLVKTLAAGESVVFTCVLITGTSAASWDAPAGGGDVSAGANITDNAIVRGDGGTKGVQTSGVIIDDSNNITGVVGLTTTGNISGGNVISSTYGYYVGVLSNSPIMDTPAADLVRWRGTDAVIPAWHTNVAGRAATDVDATNATTTMANLTDLSISLKAGRTYSGQLVLFVSDSVAADGVKVDFDGGAASATDFRAMGHIADTVSARPLAMTTAIATDLVDTTTTGSSIITIFFTITVNGAGTFIPRVAQNAHSTGTLTIFRGSFIILDDVV